MPGGAVTGRHVWVSGFVGQDAVRTDLPEFTAWALIYQAEAGEPTGLPLARAIARQVTNPALRSLAEALGG
jgi:hypothetical protein